jgi:glutamate synthase (NADPH/NADH) small chain
MKAFDFPRQQTPVYLGQRIAVVGGGNTAMDAARTARRMGPDKVYIVYRRSENEMPARREEVHHAQEEGVEFLTLTAPTQYIGTEDGWVTAMGSEFTLEVDTVIVAIGAKTNDLLLHTTPGLEAERKGYLTLDKATGMTSRPGVFAGGDIAGGEATVIAAMGDGRRAAISIDEYVKEK